MSCHFFPSEIELVSHNGVGGGGRDRGDGVGLFPDIAGMGLLLGFGESRLGLGVGVINLYCGLTTGEGGFDGGAGSGLLL